MNDISIKLKDTKEVTNLIKTCMKYDEDIDAIKGSIVVDAKSIIGVTYIGTNVEIKLKINTNDESVKNKFYSEIQNEFSVV